jgi:hypothetical protein
MPARDDCPVLDRPARHPGCRPGSAGIKSPENPGITAEEELPFFYPQKYKIQGIPGLLLKRKSRFFYPQRDKIPEIPGLLLKRNSGSFSVQR